MLRPDAAPPQMVPAVPGTVPSWVIGFEDDRVRTRRSPTPRPNAPCGSSLTSSVVSLLGIRRGEESALRHPRRFCLGVSRFLLERAANWLA